MGRENLFPTNPETAKILFRGSWRRKKRRPLANAARGDRGKRGDPSEWHFGVTEEEEFFGWSWRRAGALLHYVDSNFFEISFCFAMYFSVSI
jgi:hypothetical protein